MASRGRDAGVVDEEPAEEELGDEEYEDEPADDEPEDAEYEDDELEDDELEDDELADDELADDEYEDDEYEDDEEFEENGELPPATAVEAIRSAMRLVAQLTGRAAEGVVSMSAADGGGWCVGVEVVETRRIPDSADILAVYEATVDGDLELTGFRRTRRYSRGQVDAR